MQDDITRLSATELLGLYRRRELSPVELAEAVMRFLETQSAPGDSA